MFFLWFKATVWEFDSHQHIQWICWWDSGLVRFLFLFPIKMVHWPLVAKVWSPRTDHERPSLIFNLVLNSHRISFGKFPITQHLNDSITFVDCRERDLPVGALWRRKSRNCFTSHWFQNYLFDRFRVLNLCKNWSSRSFFFVLSLSKICNCVIFTLCTLYSVCYTVYYTPPKQLDWYRKKTLFHRSTEQLWMVSAKPLNQPLKRCPSPLRMQRN